MQNVFDFDFENHRNPKFSVPALAVATPVATQDGLVGQSGPEKSEAGSALLFGFRCGTAAGGRHVRGSRTTPHQEGCIARWDRPALDTSGQKRKKAPKGPVASCYE